MSNPFRTKEFKALNREWRERLAESGFRDHEDERENLRQHDRRTQAFTHREEVFEFFRRLDHYLTENTNIPELHRRILELYSEGKTQGEIAKHVGRCRTTVQTVFYTIRKLLS